MKDKKLTHFKFNSSIRGKIFNYFSLFCICYFYCASAVAYVSIDIGKAHVRESQMAIQPLILSGPSSSSALQAGSLIFKTMENNLSTSGYFKLIDQEAFLEKPGEKGFEPYPKDSNGFIWKNWKLLNTDYLVLGGYSFTNNTINLDLYLYHIPLKKKVFQKKYTGLCFLCGKAGS